MKVNFKRNDVDGYTKQEVVIDCFDTWSMDYTLALIIVPMLKQLITTKHGAPNTDDEDVPDELKSTSAPAKENDWSTDANHFKRWDWIMAEMLWAMEQIAQEMPEDLVIYEQYKSGLITKEEWIEGTKKYNNRVDNGCRLLGRYFRSLWD